MSKKKKIQAVARLQSNAAQGQVVSSKPESETSFFTNAWLPVLVLLAATAIVYFGSLQNDFVAFDDDKSIWYNQHLKNPTLMGIFGEQLVGMYVPITSLMYTIIYQLFGEKA